MNTILSCKFNMDTACVELKFLDGTIISINTIAVEDEVAANMYERSELEDRAQSRTVQLFTGRAV